MPDKADFSVKKGVESSFDFWLMQHPVTVPEAITDGVAKATEAWLERYSTAIIQAIATEVADRQSKRKG